MGRVCPLTALGEKKDLKNVFFLVYQLSPPGWRAGVSGWVWFPLPAE